ncbi:phosphatidylserine/phosphatidylglycerophosphate/cardiolipin synthase family protein [Candidatus Sororendozoicomonas aggregata]|uniref:phospholipase D-like domain-containing protein n=1 Tax=Candidatus Sororendozoicomonas aggregata TaxID=3073239 RepID=UPI002ED00449
MKLPGFNKKSYDLIGARKKLDQSEPESEGKRQFRSKSLTKLNPKRLFTKKEKDTRLFLYSSDRGIDRFPNIKVAGINEANVEEDFKIDAARRGTIKKYARSGEVLGVRKTESDASVKPLVPVPATGVPLPDGFDAFNKKLELIQNAQSSIVLSGNYCGGAPFDEVLDAMEERLTNKPELKIVVMSSPRFITKTNREKLDRIKDNFNNRFKFVLCGEKWLDSEKAFKRITNHTKGLVVDGKHCVMGGSGIEERFSYSRGTGAGLEKAPDPASARRTALNSAIARSFRDLDFYLEGEALGKQVGNELLHLAKLWMLYDKENRANPDAQAIDGLMASYEQENNTGAEGEEAIANSSDAVGQCQVFSSGPEMGESEFNRHMIETIRSAKDVIYVDHLYFHPTKEIRELLAEKVNAGVKLTIVTNGSKSHAPTANKAFAPRSKYEIAKMLSNIDKDKRHNVNVYEFGHKEAASINLHKKVIVADDKVLAGSSNFGYKSLVTSSDHEINFLMESKDFAQKTIDAIEQDFKKPHTVYEKARGKEGGIVAKTDKLDNEKLLPLSVKRDKPETITLKRRLVTFVHRRLAWLIG